MICVASCGIGCSSGVSGMRVMCFFYVMKHREGASIGVKLCAKSWRTIDFTSNFTSKITRKITSKISSKITSKITRGETPRTFTSSRTIKLQNIPDF